MTPTTASDLISDSADNSKQLSVDFEERGLSQYPVAAIPEDNVPFISYKSPIAGSYENNSSAWLPSGLYEDNPFTRLLEVQQMDNSFSLVVCNFLMRLKRDVTTQQWAVLGEYATHGAKEFRVQLTEALRDLSEVIEEAKEEGYPIPNEIAISNAGLLLRKIYDESPRKFEVYPMPDGEVAIDVPNGKGSSVMVLCDSDGGALCLVNIKGKHRRARYSSAEALPDGFICEALEELDYQSNQA